MFDNRISKAIAPLEGTTRYTAKGISFALRTGNRMEYVTIPTTPDQKFHYFYNPSKLSKAERDARWQASHGISILTASAKTNEDIKDKRAVIDAVDKLYIKNIKKRE